MSAARSASNGAHGDELTIGLPAELTEAVVQRAAELIAESTRTLEPLLTVAELAEQLRVAPDWVRRHQAELGAFRLTEGGGRNPIRFRASDVERFLEQRRLRPPASKTGASDWRSDPDWAAG